MIGNLHAYLSRGYEAGVYRLNPCDLGCARWLRPFGRAAKHFGSDCRCCSGSRVLAVALLAAIAPVVIPVIVVLWYLAALSKELWSPTPEFQEPYDAYDEGSMDMEQQ